jgi:hypothetical protein
MLVLPSLLDANRDLTADPVSLATKVLLILGIKTLDPYFIILGSTAIVLFFKGLIPVEVLL